MKKVVRYENLMGSAFSLGLLTPTEKEAHDLLTIGVNEIKRIESLLSFYKKDSITSKINQHTSSKPLIIHKEVFELIHRCQNISKLTNGCFDITASSLSTLYSFKNRELEMPSHSMIQQKLEHVGFDRLDLDKKNCTLTKNDPKTTLNFNAVGKGYAADMVKKLWLKLGVTSGFINSSGDLCSFGTTLEGDPWKVGIMHPDHKNEPMLFVPILNQAIATSGDYEQFFTYQGERYSHNINPLTGYPLKGLKSVSVVSPSAELSDALATAIYVMGAKKGVEFINQLPQTFAIMVNDQNQLILSKKLNYEATSI